MNTSHPLTEQATFEPWLERAKLHVGPDVRCIGSGRWMLTTVDDPKRCLLFETYTEARAMVAVPARCRVIDLASKTLMEKIEAMPDRYPD
jgi:hypothetical protein